MLCATDEFSRKIFVVFNGKYSRVEGGGGGGGIDVTTAIFNFELIAIHCGLIQDNLIFKLP